MNNFKNFFNRSYIKGILFFIFLYLLIPAELFSNNYLCTYSYLDTCIDDSWKLSINWALKKHFIFGKDYIFTYGPLGFLSTRVAMGFNPLLFLLFDLFILGNAAFIFLYILRKYYKTLVIILTFLAVFTLASDRMYTDHIVFILLLIIIFWVNFSLKYSQISGFIVPIIATVLAFFIKANTSFVALLIFYGYFGYFCFLNKNKPITKALFGAAIPCLILAADHFLNVEIGGYIKGSFELIDGYNDAQYIVREGSAYYVYSAIVLIVVSLFCFFIKNIKQNLGLFITSGIITYVLFKQSFVRSGTEHMTTFFAVFPAMYCIIVIFYRTISNLQIVILVPIICFCYSTGLSLKNYENSLFRVNYFLQFFSPSTDKELMEFKSNQFRLPNEMKEIIGQDSVDIIPWHINYLYLNQLNYLPRPVIQSYTVYTPYLIDLNKQKYAGASSPEFVIYSELSIDNRYPFFDDQEAKLELIKNYEFKGIFQADTNTFVLLKKRPGNARIEISPANEEAIFFNQDYNLKNINKMYFIKFNVRYLPLGKVIRFFYKPFIISIIFTLEDGSVKQKRAILPILNNGVVINPYIENELDFVNFVSGGLSTNAKKIKSFRIELDNATDFKEFAGRTYNQEIKMSVSEFEIIK